MRRALTRGVVGAVVLFASALSSTGEDWPEWRGMGRLGVWTESDILDRFPVDGLVVRWRAPIGSGYAGPSVSESRVFAMDFEAGERNRGTERLVALSEATGEILWTKSWPVDYTGFQLIYAIGPRATPTVDGDRVYAMGATGHLVAAKVDSGELLWEKDFVRDYETTVPVWGMAGAPLVEGDLVIALAGGEPDAKLVAFDKHTGKEVWRALSSDWEPGYGQPIAFEAGGVRQLVLWHPRAVSSLDPRTGDIYWEVPFIVSMGMTVSTPIVSGRHLFVGSFREGGRMIELASDRPEASLLWEGQSTSEVETDTVHTLINTPVIDGDYLYGIDSYGQLRCLRVDTGARVWETQAVTVERARWAAAFFVRHEDRYFINNDRGELILARLSPEGYDEIDRTELIEPTSPSARRRERGAVHWSHPAYANRHLFVRNDEELIKVSLER